MSEEQQPKKKDAVADALAALAAGEHVEEAPLSGSGMAGQSDHVQLTPAPVPMPRPAKTPQQSPPTPPVAPKRPPVAPLPPAVAGGQQQPKVRVGPPAGSSKVAGARPTTPGFGQAAPGAGAAQARGTGGGAGSAQRPPAAGAPAARRPAGPGVAPPAPVRAPGGNAAQAAPGAVRPIAPGTGEAGKRPAGPRAVVQNSPARPTPASVPPIRAVTPRRPVGPAAPVAPVTPVPPPGPPAPADAFVVHDDTGSPSEHVPSAHELEVAAEADAIAHVVEDDDTLNMPAPGPEAFAPRRPAVRPKRELVTRTVGFKQTLIPVLLSQGVVLSGLAAYLLVLGEDSPLAGNTWIPFSLLGIGVVLLVLWVLTGLQVRHQLAKAAAV